MIGASLGTIREYLEKKGENDVTDSGLAVI